MDSELRATIESWTPSPTATPRDIDWFPRVFEEAPFGIAAIDMAGNFVRVNRACARLHGKTVEEMQRSDALQPPLEDTRRPEFEQLFDLAREGEVPRYEAEHQIPVPDGSVVWAKVTGSTVHDVDGRPAYFLLQYHDTTDLHEYADLARATSQAYELTFENAPIAIYTVDLDGQVIAWNSLAEQMFGWSASEVLGSPIPIVPDEGRDAAIEGFHQLMAGETIAAREAVLRHRDGHLVHVVTSAAVTQSSAREPAHIVAFTLDVTAQHEAEERLKTSEMRLRTIFAKTSDTVTVVDPDGEIVFSAAEYYETLGYPTDFWQEVSVFDLIHPEDIEKAAARWAEVLESPGQEFDEVLRLRNADGTHEAVEVTAINLIDDPDIAGIVLTTRFLTGLRRATELLSDEARILELIALEGDLDAILDAIAEMVERNTRGGLTSIMLHEDGLMRLAAAPNAPSWVLEQVDGAPPSGLFNDVLDGGGRVVISDLDNHPHTADQADRIRRRGIESYWLLPIISSGTEEVLGILGSYFAKPTQPSDHELRVAELGAQLSALAIERHRAFRSLLHQALHDPLTGLANRSLILQHLERMLDESRRTDRRVSVMFLDLDRFKVINDSLGHKAGDALLQQFGERIDSLVRPGDLLGRFSADEFVMLVLEEAESDVYTVAGRIEVALSEAFTVDGNDIFLQLSTGVAQSDDDTTADQLIEQSAAAMVEAKRRGRDRLEVFDHRMRADSRARLQLEGDLRQAADRGEFVLYYQPKIDLATGQIVGAEALIRWHHPERGLVGPDQFIPAAEETGLIVRIGRWVLEEAVQQAHEWTEAFPNLAHFVMGVNFSARQISAPDLITNLGRVLLRYGWPPDRLSVELTESILIEDADSSLEVVKALKNLGVRLTIDDFGTGYSSLSYLHRFPVDIVKIDRAFVTPLQSDGTGSTVAAAIMHMATDLQLVTAAEGVETEEQLAGLQALGCHWAQGFLFSKAVPPDEFAVLLEQGIEFPGL